MKKRFLNWLEGVFEDDPLPYGINTLDFCLINNYPRVELGFYGSQDGLFPLYYPLEAQCFFDNNFFNLNLSDEKLIDLVTEMIEYAFEYISNKQYFDTKITIRGKLYKKNSYFLVKHI